jgi:predicted small secreted protein
MARKFLSIVMMLGLLAPLFAVSGCNTMAGAGQDIERGGQKIQGEAERVQHKI